MNPADSIASAPQELRLFASRLWDSRLPLAPGPTMAAAAQQGAIGLGFLLGLEESPDGCGACGQRVADVVAAVPPTVAGVFDLPQPRLSGMLSGAVIKTVDGTAPLIACEANPITTGEDGTQHVMILGADHAVTLELDSVRVYTTAILPGLFGPGLMLCAVVERDAGRLHRRLRPHPLPRQYHANECYKYITIAMPQPRPAPPRPAPPPGRRRGVWW